MPNVTDRTLRHNFAIWVLGRNPGLFKPQRYMYRCVRCKWTFVVNDGKRGEVRAVADDNGGSLSPEESHERLSTFAHGPCPGLNAVTRAPIFKEPPKRRMARIRRAN